MSEPGSKRGRTHDAEGAREAILNAAEQVFAEHGFDGARVDAIARVAGYNKSLIFQYFGDKLGLYAEMIRRADDQTRDMQNAALSGFNTETALSPEQIRALFRQFVGQYFDFLVAHPQIMRIYNWEMAEGWQTFSKIVSQRDFDDVDQFTVVLIKVQRAGLLRSNLNPIVQMTPAIFMGLMFLAMLPLFRILLPGVDLTSPAALESAREYFIGFVSHGLLRDPVEVGEPNAA
jgi:TetR/AcrR family transcriptional regulator